MGGWNDWIYLEPRPHPLIHRQEEVEAEVHAELAQTLETQLRARVEPGVDLRRGAKGHSLRVAAEGNRLVIDGGEDHGVRGAAARPEPRPRARLEDLFHTTLAAPEALDDGSLAFRVLHEEDLLGAQAEQDELVDRTAQEVVRAELVDAFERAVKKIELAHPADKAR